MKISKAVEPLLQNMVPDWKTFPEQWFAYDLLSDLKYRKKVMVLVSMDVVSVEDACWTYFDVI